MNNIDSKILLSLRHPLSIVGYALFLCAYVLLKTNNIEYVYVFLFIGCIAIIGGFILAYRQTNSNEVEIKRNIDSTVKKNTIKTKTKIEENTNTKIEENEIG